MRLNTDNDRTVYVSVFIIFMMTLIIGGYLLQRLFF